MIRKDGGKRRPSIKNKLEKTRGTKYPCKQKRKKRIQDG